LARPDDRHLTQDELEALVSSRSLQERELPSTGYDSEDVSSHMAECEKCRLLAASYAAVEVRLASLRSNDNVLRSDGCPPHEEWLNLVAGLVPAERGQRDIQHAATCDHCGPILRKTMGDLEDQVTADEQSFVDGLLTSDREWQKGFAVRLSGLTQGHSDKTGTRSSHWGVPVFWGRLAFIGIALVLLAIASWVGLNKLSSPSATQLLAQAYTEHRTLEMRIPGAKYAPVRIERGKTRSSLDKSQALLNAEALIGENLRKKPSDPVWLETKGRADLLDSNYDSAINSLERARDIQPDSPYILNDLASAYFERARSTDRAIDYGTAIDFLGKALAKSPDDPVLLFNQAIATEQMLLYDEAIKDWERFLAVEHDAEWAGEGRRRLQALRERLRSRDQSYVIPPTDPTAAVPLLRARLYNLGSHDCPSLLDEAYLSVAITDWLPMLLSPSLSVPNSEISSAPRVALIGLSKVLSSCHGDTWLIDLLRQKPSSSWLNGIRELSAAVRANGQGNAAQGISHALLAKEHFSLTGNPAGELRAQLEHLIGVNRLQEGNRCLAVAMDGLQRTREHTYPWIEASLLLETATCYSLAGNPGKAEQFARKAAAQTLSSGYASLHLRTLYYDDGVTTPGVASPEAWLRIRAGLQEYWKASYPPMSALDFYSDLGFAAEDSEMWHFAEAAGRESVLMASRTRDYGFEAASHHWLAQVCEMAGDTQEAEQEYQRAGEIFSQLTNSSSAEITTEIERASLEVERGDLDEASMRLQSIKDKFPNVQNSSASMLYHLSLGELNLRRKNVRIAEEELKTTITISEQGSTSLTQETDRLSWNRNTGKAYRCLVELYCQSYHDGLKSLALLEWYRGAPLRTGTKNNRGLQRGMASQNIPSTSIDQINRSVSHLELVPGTAVLTWALFPSGVNVWLYDANGVYSAWTYVSLNELRKTVDRFARLCADPSSDSVEISRDGRQLYEWLVRPVASKLETSVILTVEPDDFLNKVPFSALMTEDSSYWGSRFSIVESPGMAYSYLLRADIAISGEQRLLAVGNPLLQSRNDSALRPLQDADAEARDVASRFRHSYLLTGGEATFRNVLAQLARAQIFHFAGHAISGGRESGLLLAAERSGQASSALLEGSDLLPEQLSLLRLVVLSGCETAVADDGLADSNSLVRAFLRAGVPQVVASKWPVDSLVSREMTNYLYDDLLRGKPAATALAYAQRRVSSQPATSHPYYWAAFSTFGRSE
jgi:CHAT domain-containing protein/tetratricopeptide (TPR) repeat protein